jgi:hypothetical protein
VLATKGAGEQSEEVPATIESALVVVAAVLADTVIEAQPRTICSNRVAW